MTADRLTPEREPFTDAQLDEMQEFASELDDDLGPLFGRDVVWALGDLRAELAALRADLAAAEQERELASVSRDQAYRILGDRVELLEAALAEANEKLGVVTGTNYALLFTPAQIDWLINWLGGFPVTNETAAWITAELHRAKRYDKREALASPADKERT